MHTAAHSTAPVYVRLEILPLLESNSQRTALRIIAWPLTDRVLWRLKAASLCALVSSPYARSRGSGILRFNKPSKRGNNLRLWCLTPKYQFVSALSNDAKAIGRDAHARYRTVESYELVPVHF